MLILSRRKREKIVIQAPGGELIEVLIVDPRTDRVRVGVKAPEAYIVDREEIYERRLAEREQELDAEGAKRAPV